MFSSQAPSLNAFWAGLIIEELFRHHLDTFFISPGSRSSPLTLAAAARTDARVIMHFDERGAAYAAAGYGRAAGRPGVLICTSGTAAANYFPAVVEASMEQIPMILLTADRPPELHNCGANQTINQNGLYGVFPRYFCDLPTPDEKLKPETALSAIDQAFYHATEINAGPVHLNCPFREPLSPPDALNDYSSSFDNLSEWRHSQTPYDTPTTAEAAMPDNDVRYLSGILNSADKLLFVVGEFRSREQVIPVRELAERLRVPVFADIRSQLRAGAKNTVIVKHYDQLLLSERFCKCDGYTIVHWGGRLVSKRWQETIARSSLNHYIQISTSNGPIDPERQLTHRYQANPSKIGERLLSLIQTRAASELLREFQDADRVIAMKIDSFISAAALPSEIALAGRLLQATESPRVVFLGNSMPIRDFDMYAGSYSERILLAGNRGVSGIDGNVASLAGLSIGSDLPGTIVLGDLALLHDLNSLSLLDKTGRPQIVIVINNNGGGIFSFLPVAQMTVRFETFFGTPHGYNFESVAGMFRMEYSRPKTHAEFIESYVAAQRSDQNTLIEVVTNRQRNFEEHQWLQEAIQNTLRKL